MVIRFNGFEIDVARGVLHKAGSTIRLRNQSLLVLTALASSAGETVTADELRRVVWGDHTFVDFEQGLRSCVKEIRAVLGDDAADPVYIKTLPRVGYRFVAAAERVGEEELAPERTAPKRTGGERLPGFAPQEEPPVTVPA